MPSCNTCQATISFNYDRPQPPKAYTVWDVAREAPHDAFCSKPKPPAPKPVLIATDHVIENKKMINLGFLVDLREEWKAKLVVDECVRCSLDPEKVTVVRMGDYLHIKQQKP